MMTVNETCRMLDLQPARLAFSLARAKAGRSRAARMAMIAITTNSSISVKPRQRAADWNPL
jgi:hypothetical protein